MSVLKNGLFILFALTAVLFTSCNNDDDCTAPAISENIIGEWRLVTGDVEFQADGTLIDPDDALFGVEINGTVYDQKTWAVSGTTLTITAMPSNGSGTSSADFEITENECDEITLEESFFGISVTMDRR